MILEPMIYAPAEPKTKESKAPILTMALWTIAVSYWVLSIREVAAD